MNIRFGYVANATSLWNCSPSKKITFTRWKDLSKDEQRAKLYDITKQNLEHTIRILYYNIAHEIPLYRFSSTMIPLATHREVDFPYTDLFVSELKEIGNIVQKHGLRVSFHPGQFTLFTSDKTHITANAITDMEYHYSLLKAMGIADTSYLNIHVGGAYGNKTEALLRFHENLKQLPSHIKQQMTLENDDKTYTIAETLTVCQKEKVPMMLDYHHHIANPTTMELETLLPDIFKTWDHTGLTPKVHLSSPKGEKEFRSHADFVDLAFIQPFLEMARSLGQNFDVMIESKKKDLALHQLMEDISKLRGYTRIGGATFQVK